MKNLFFHVGKLGIVFGMVLVLGCVAPDQYQSLENRIAAIEMENNRQASAGKEKLGRTSQNLESLQLQFDDFTKTDREHYAEIKSEIQEIKEQFRKVNGLIEEINYHFGTNSQARQEQLEKKIDRLDNAISRNYEKIITLEKYMGFEPSVSAKPPQDKGLPPAEPGIATEEESYAIAKKMFDDGDKDNARIHFENFINKFPDSKNADNARFWIADSYYAEKWYEKAILEYQKVLENYPDSNKTAAARLKQGYSFAELGETANARLILKELIKRHPDSNEAKYARKKLKSLN